ncbi:hypothetical protein NDU88_005407 [Pleurodeles waltl]|uniref:Uncharacterized protein n=1 Tax=Pleurodeles waltl TaxID=8319 RepID=A0AAV7M977_PLEWA|nr:hypothetical protein NDU88_005407 [Pleurodeles waltl]
MGKSKRPAPLQRNTMQLYTTPALLGQQETCLTRHGTDVELVTPVIETTRAELLAAIQGSRETLKEKIELVAVEVNLLWEDLRKWGPAGQHVRGRHVPPDLLADPACRETTVSVLMDYVEFNCQSATTKALGWEALKAVMRAACVGVTCGVRCQLEATLGMQERKLTVLQDSGETSQEVRQEMLQVQHFLCLLDMRGRCVRVCTHYVCHRLSAWTVFCTIHYGGMPVFDCPFFPAQRSFSCVKSEAVHAGRTSADISDCQVLIRLYRFINARVTFNLRGVRTGEGFMRCWTSVVEGSPKRVETKTRR